MGAVYSQLSIEERRKMDRWRHAKVPVDEMARVLKRCCSTIFRELKWNHFSDLCLPKCDGYYGAAAQLKAADRCAQQRKLIKHPVLRKRVIERLKNGWRFIKRRIKPMLEFKSFDSAASALAGIELVSMVRKGQFTPGLSPFQQFSQLAG